VPRLSFTWSPSPTSARSARVAGIVIAATLAATTAATLITTESASASGIFSSSSRSKPKKLNQIKLDIPPTEDAESGPSQTSKPRPETLYQERVDHLEILDARPKKAEDKVAKVQEQVPPGSPGVEEAADKLSSMSLDDLLERVNKAAVQTVNWDKVYYKGVDKATDDKYKKLFKHLEQVNPNWASGDDAYRHNCQKCAIAAVRVLRGEKATAAPHPESERTGGDSEYMEQQVGKGNKFISMPVKKMVQILLAGGDGTMGIVSGANLRVDGKVHKGPGHAFVGVNINDSIYFVDAQTDTWADVMKVIKPKFLLTPK
jgi:hypothetical protein